GLPELTSIYPQAPMLFDPISGLVLRGHKARRLAEESDPFTGMWLYDPVAGKCRKSQAPLPGYAINQHGMAYESLRGEVLYFLPTGVHRYDRDKDRWDQVAIGDFRVYLVDFDPGNNVFLALRRNLGGPGSFAALRFENAPVGARARMGKPIQEP